MKRSRPKRPMSALDYSAFSRGVFALHGDGCWACRTDTSNRWKCHDRSDGRLDFHHILSQSLLRREVPAELLPAALADPRNGVPLRRYHHDLVEHNMVYIEIPEVAWVFAADFELAWALERIERLAA